MSIWGDHAIKELQEKVLWLEKEVEQLKHKEAERKDAGPTRLTLPGKGKPS